MEFHVSGLPATADIAVISDAISALDPAVLVDLDPSTGAVRVNAAISADDLARAIVDAGQDVEGFAVMQQPSVCCGGCGG